MCFVREIILFTVTFLAVASAAEVCPSSCYCDESGEYVACVGDGIWPFPTNVPNSTLRLELRNYLVPGLTAEDFGSLTELQEVKLQQSRIETIENATFASNLMLQRLDLSQNLISSLTSAVLKDLNRLRFLDLSSNLIEYVEEAFVDLVNLEQLNIRDNRIPQLTTHTFLGLHKVQYLNLDANNISSIEVGTFQYLTNLAHLIISNNPLTSLSRLDFFGSRLQFIDISHVGIDRVPQSLTKFVRDLRLAKNNLTHISAGDFDSYPYLGLLVLDDNCVSEIENDALGRQEYLMRLWLNGNCLTRVPPNLPPSLLALYMEENKLTDLPSYSFKGLIHLEQLFLQRNEIVNLAPCVFCDLVSLKSLDLQANQIENITAGVFSNLTQLETLDLSQNKLKMIDSHSFDSLGRLKTLQMSRVPTSIRLDQAMFDPLHGLQTLEVYDSSLLVHIIINSTRMLHGLRKVQELNIMHNRITKLRYDFPSFFPSLKIIKMSGNLWHCDKDIVWLSNWIKQSNVQFYSSYSIRCTTPESLHSKPLMMLNDNDFEESTTVSITSTSANGSSTASTTKAISEGSTVSSSTMTVTSVLQASTSVRIYNRTSTEKTTSTALTPTETISPTENITEPKLISAHPYRYQIINNDKDGHTPETPPADTSTTVATSKKSTDSESTTHLGYLTPEDKHTTPTPTTMLPTEVMKDSIALESKQKDLRLELPSKDRSQTVAPQRRVLSSRLRVITGPTSEPIWWDHTTTIVVSAGVAGGGFLVVVISVIVFTLLRCKHRYQPVKHRNMRRSSSISYYPQKDEVSIVTLSEGTVGLRTSSHHGLGNKLYYIMENGGNATDVTRDALPDSQLQELLPQSSTEFVSVY